MGRGRRRPSRQQKVGLECGSCFQRFADLAQLKTHLEQCPEGRLATDICDECGSVFHERFKYDLHLMEHRKEFVCGDCDKK